MFCVLIADGQPGPHFRLEPCLPDRVLGGVRQPTRSGRFGFGPGPLGTGDRPFNLGERRGDDMCAESLLFLQEGISTRSVRRVGVPLQVPVAPRFTGGVSNR